MVSVTSAMFLLLIMTPLFGEKLLESSNELVLIVHATLFLVNMGTFLLCFGLIFLVTNLFIYGTKVIRIYYYISIIDFWLR